MDRGVRIGAADGSPAGPAHAPRPHPGDERRKLPVERQQAPTPREASLLVTVCFTAPICRVGFRSGLSAPRKAGRRPTLQPPPQIPQSKPQLPRKWSTLSPLQWSIFTPPLTQTTAPTISRWKQRFEQNGLAGLDPRHKGSQPRVANAAMQARIARKTLQKPGDGSTHWSCRKMAQALKLSKSTVQRVWAQARLKPHRLDSYMVSDDPHFEEKAADIIGLYLNPPQHAAVFCVDEKTAIQALDRLDPVLPLSPGRAERHGFEYYRHGTLSLYAALDVKTGAVHGMTAARHTSREFITFLRSEE